MKSSFSLILSLAAPLLLASCFPKDLKGSTYSRDETGQAQSIRTGTIESARFVKIQAGQTAGSTIGAIAGGIAGAQIGEGSGSTLGAIGGTALGAAAGGAVQQATGNKQGIELTIRMDDGETISVVQQHDERETYNSGDRVRVHYGSGRIRVSH